MKKITIILFLLLIAINVFSYFTTEYSIVDTLSEEWQQAGVTGGCQSIIPIISLTLHQI